MHTAIILFDGFDNLDAIGPFEVFNHVHTLGADIDVGLYRVTEQEVVTSSHRLRIKPDGVLGRQVSIPDIVVVPGGGWGEWAEAGALGEAERGDLPEALKRLSAGGATVAGGCTGRMLLARAGVTDGRRAVTHHGALEDLRDSGADVVEAHVVDDGDLVTQVVSRPAAISRFTWSIESSGRTWQTAS